MANQKHLDILRQGVESWNQWRKNHPDIKPDLSQSYLSGAYLSRANLNEVNLSGTDLSWTYFSRINLSKANLRGTNLYKSYLSKANLCEADLRGTNLSGVDLSGADLSNAYTHLTIFGDIDLRQVKGLELINHIGPSTLGIDTIIRSKGIISEIFLRGVGVPEVFIISARALAENNIEYNTCFISYSGKDQPFAERLYADLQTNGVRCWFAPEDMKIGDKIRIRIDESIRLYDKLLLVLSEHSVKSEWVEHEVEMALAKERRENRTVLFPIRLDEAIMEMEYDGWPADVRHMRHIGDFTKWKQHDDYQQAFERLLRDLQAEI